MNYSIRLPLKAEPEQVERLAELQRAFAHACNALAPMAQQNRCWNRVALHHMAYRQMRERFPGLGSQMVCNAIYSVSRSCRLVYQHPESPFNVARLGDKPLPRLHFLPHSPVYFDRHTLSIKAGEVSMFTLDGRMRFRLGLTPQQELRFRQRKLREIVLSGDRRQYALTFAFAPDEQEADDAPADAGAATAAASPEMPEYVLVVDTSAAPASAPAPAAQPTLPTPAP